MKWRRVFLGLVFTAIVLAAASYAFYQNAGRWLDYSESPVRSDVIIVLGGGPPQRVDKAVQLYREGYAPILLTSGGAVYNPWSDQAQEMAKQAEEMGVSQRHILLENHSQSTYENAVDTLAILEAHHFTSAIVVSSDYHMLRVAFDFTRAYLGSGIRLTYCAAPDPYFHPDDWRANPISIQTTKSEYLDLIASVLFYTF